ncbi:MAG: amino acid decarboxylase [Chitinophagaceae bacterium]|nr:amino acid decarboxylase [Chitinophagaceae bacterium]
MEKEYSLDPADWGEIRRLGHRMVDDMMDYLSTVRDRPAWVKMTETAAERLAQPLPQGPQDAADVYEDFLHSVLPYNKGNVHPRFWSWVEGGGTPFGMLADMLASGMNANVAIGDHAAMYVDLQVLDWSKEMFGFPPSASGMLTSGGSIANITALIVARNHFHAAVKRKGLRVVDGQMIVYGSSETHNCVAKGVEVIGIGSDNFRKVPVDENYRVRTDVLRAMIREDRETGHHPFCLIGNAGTVNTGAIDDLMELAAIAREEGLWYHIDGAFGAVPYILPAFRDKLKGLELADSLSFDFHKWLYMNYEVGCVLIRDGTVHRAAFSTSVNYLMQHERGLSAGPDSFTNYGMELSRGFKALKVWMLLKEHGLEKYAGLVRQNLDQAQYLGRLIEESEELELLADVSLNIVCYRWNPGKRGDRGTPSGAVAMEQEELNAVNKEILMRMHEEGVALPSYTLLNGRYAIRVAITNHRSRLEDFDALVAASVRISKNIHITQ